ncbi:Bro-N domain-containing protein [Streptomyces sp. NPDC058614]|uniref:BRO-N domain-containing protein n=1 Tax=Streptomyces sp. NPDC058614 TaxID=3346557 RepID=UPI003658DA13
MFAATGVRVRRLTLPDGEHWFPAADVAGSLGYANTRHALRLHVAESLQKRLDQIAQGVAGSDTLRKLTGHRLQKSMKMVNLKGLIQLVNGCTKPECEPFKAWVSEVIETIQRDGSYSLEPSPVQTPATDAPSYVMPKQVADAIVRLEMRNIQADEMMAAYLAPALVRGEATYRMEDIATRTGLSHARVHDCLRTLLKRGCMRQTGCAADGAPIYVLP